jgi:hypothetical protein
MIKINMGRRRKKEENWHTMKEGKKEIVVYNKNEYKHSEKLIIRLSERKNNLSR